MSATSGPPKGRLPAGATMADVRAVDPELATLIDIARKASALVMEVYATDFDVKMKGPSDPVTRADLEANALICAALSEAFPDDAIIAEESVPRDPDELARRLARDRVFFVDPVDGTKEFANRNGEFAVMIGLCIDGVAEVGVVAVPAAGQMLFGRVGSPDGVAFLEPSPGAPLERLTVSTVDDPREARVVVSSSHRSPRLVPILEHLGVTRDLECGSVGVKVARVVTSAADLYVHPTRGASKWDACAPSAILCAAGGRFTDSEGHEIDYRESDLSLARGIAATNGHLHARVIEAVRATAG